MNICLLEDKTFKRLGKTYSIFHQVECQNVVIGIALGKFQGKYLCEMKQRSQYGDGETCRNSGLTY